MRTSTSPRRWALPLLLLLLLVAAPAPARAVSLLSLGGGAFVEDTTQPENYFGADFSHQTSTELLLQDGRFGSVMTQSSSTAGTVLVQGRASYGVLGAEATLNLFAPGVGGDRHNGSGNVAATFIDDITIVPDDATLFGQTGYLHATLHLTGSVFVDADNVPILGQNDARSFMSSGWSVNVGLFDGTSSDLATWNSAAQLFGGLSPVFTGPQAPTVLSFELPIRLGRTEELSVYLFVQSAGTALASRGDVFGSVALHNTLAWGGISAITTADGTPIAYQLSSLSGTDWTQAASVPEPATGALLSTVVLAALAAWRLVARPA